MKILVSDVLLTRNKPTQFRDIYSIWYGNECASSLGSDVDFYVIIRELLDSVFNIFPVFMQQWGNQMYLHRLCTVRLHTQSMTYTGS
jgi:hypothetical protein